MYGMNRRDVFREEDFQRAIELESGREDEGWSRTGVCKEGAEFWKMVDYNAAVPLHLKCKIRLDGVPLEKCRELLTNPELRNEWDGAKFQVEQLARNPYYSTIYWIFHLPSVVKDRDMVQVTTVRWIPEQKAYVILYKDGQHVSKPETDDYIRMKTGLSYTILRRAEDDPDSTIMSTLGNNEYGGWLPYAVMGPIYASSLTKLSHRLKEAYKEYSQDQRQVKKLTPKPSVASHQERYKTMLPLKDQR